MNEYITPVCKWKGASESTSYEGKQYREYHPEIPFSFCRKSCDGYDYNCALFQRSTLVKIALTVQESVPIDEDIEFLERIRTYEGASYD